MSLMPLALIVSTMTLPVSLLGLWPLLVLLTRELPWQTVAWWR
jgi:hypothetical protein